MYIRSGILIIESFVARSPQSISGPTSKLLSMQSFNRNASILIGKPKLKLLTFPLFFPILRQRIFLFNFFALVVPCHICTLRHESKISKGKLLHKFRTGAPISNPTFICVLFDSMKYCNRLIINIWVILILF